MFKQRLRSIWTKIQNGEYVSAADKFILYLNDLGYTGLGIGVAAILTTFLAFGGGSFLLVPYEWAAVSLWTLFVQRNWTSIKRAYKKQWKRIFPEGLKLPSGNIIK